MYTQFAAFGFQKTFISRPALLVTEQKFSPNVMYFAALVCLLSFFFCFFFQNIFLRGNIYLRVVVSAYGGNSKEFQSFFPHTLLFSFSYSSTLRAFRSHKIQVCSSLGAKYNDNSSHICFSMHTEYRRFAWCEFLSKPNWSVEIIATDRTDNIFKPRSYLRPHMM